MSRRVLVCGMSGTGKSTIAAELLARGHRAVDVDQGYVVPTDDGRQLWDEPRIEALLDAPDELLFVLGLEENGVRLLPRFDAVVLLSAPVEVLTERLATRTTNPFGKDPAEAGPDPRRRARGRAAPAPRGHRRDRHHRTARRRGR